MTDPNFDQKIKEVEMTGAEKWAAIKAKMGNKSM